jgi:hypothetical protein
MLTLSGPTGMSTTTSQRSFRRYGNWSATKDFLKLRGKDSNLDYLIQSQASYH